MDDQTNSPEAERTAAVRALAVTKRYPKRRRDDPDHALNGFDLELPPGRLALLVGPNGAGKSTALRLLAGIEVPTSGTLSVLGDRPRSMAVRRAIGYLADSSRLFPFLDARETLDFFGRAAGLSRSELARRADAWSERLGISDYGRKRVGTFSMGMRRRLGLACVLLAEPRVLLLDEPTSGLDPEGMRLFLDLIAREKARGAAVVMSSHHLAHAEEIADFVIVLARGKTRLATDVAALAARVDVRALDVTGLDLAARGEVVREIERLGGRLESDRAAESGLQAFLRELTEDAD